MNLNKRLQMDLPETVCLFFSTILRDEVINTLLRQIQSKFNSFACSIWAYDAPMHEFICIKNTHNFSPKIDGSTIFENEGLLGSVRMTKKGIISNNAENDYRHSSFITDKLNLVIRSIICVPIILDGEVIGALEVVDKNPSKFKPADLKLIEDIVNTTTHNFENGN